MISQEHDPFTICNFPVESKMFWGFVMDQLIGIDKPIRQIQKDIFFGQPNL